MSPVGGTTPIAMCAGPYSACRSIHISAEGLPNPNPNPTPTPCDREPTPHLLTCTMTHWTTMVKTMIISNMGLAPMPLKMLTSSPIDRALNSLKIWQKTKALKMMVRWRVDPISTGTTALEPSMCTQYESAPKTSLTLVGRSLQEGQAGGVRTRAVPVPERYLRLSQR